MKKLINKIKRVMNDHPRIFVLLLVLFLIIVIFVIYRIADEYMNYSEVIKEDTYTFVGEKKHVFESEITINRKGVISKVDPSINMNWTSTPIFGENKIIFPNNMLIVFPQENYSEYRLMPFSYIENDNIVTSNFNNKLEHYLIYDGLDTYIFSDNGILKVGNNNIKLSSYSYVICDQKRVSYYDSVTDKVTSIILDGDVIFESDYYVVNLIEDSVGNEGNLLPSSVEYVDFISKYRNLH